MNLVFQLFPLNESYLYDPRVTGLITAALAVVVIIVWGPRTLVRARRPWVSLGEAVAPAAEAQP